MRKVLGVILIQIIFSGLQAQAGSIFYVVPNYNGGTDVTCKITECTWTSTADGAPSCNNAISVTPGTAGVRTTSTGTSFKVAYGWCQITPAAASGSFTQTNATGAGCWNPSYGSNYTTSTSFMSTTCQAIVSGNTGAMGWINILGTQTEAKNGGIAFDINGGRPY